jgi:hypothetical protein
MRAPADRHDEGISRRQFVALAGDFSLDGPHAGRIADLAGTIAKRENGVHRTAEIAVAC